MNILFLSRWFPYPPNNGAKVRIVNLLRILARTHQVTLLSFNDQPDVPIQTDGLQQICVETVSVPWKAYRPNSVKAAFGLFSPTPRAVIDTFSPEMAQQIRSLQAKHSYDAIIASEIEMASYSACFGTPAAIFEEVEVGVPLERYTLSTTFRSRFRYGLTWFKHKHYLTRLLKKFPFCTVVSEQERKLLQDTGIRDRDIAVIPNCVDLADYQAIAPQQKQNALIFTGSFRYQPNYEAMLWFTENVFSVISARFPDIQLIITGDHLGLPLPVKKNVVLTGNLDDIRPKIASAAVSVVPLLSGGGTRLKILEALALKTPVVSTTKGAEGLEVTDGENILIADTPAAFAHGVMKVLDDHQLGRRLADNGYNLVNEKYSAEAIAARYNTLLDQLHRKTI